jgi:hypothetical protein
MFGGFPTIPYLAPEVEAIDVHEPLREPPPPGFVPRDKNLAFVFLPHRAHELELVRATFPGGQRIDGPSPFPGQPPLYVLYNVRLPASSLESGG